MCFTFGLVGLGAGYAQFDDFHDSGRALFVLEKVGVVEDPRTAAVEGRHDRRVQVLGVGWRPAPP